MSGRLPTKWNRIIFPTEGKNIPGISYMLPCEDGTVICRKGAFLHWNIQIPSLPIGTGNEGIYADAGRRRGPLFCPVAVQKDRYFAAVGFDARNGQIRRADHEIDVNHGIIQSGLFRFFLRHFRSAGKAGRIGRAES